MTFRLITTDCPWPENGGGGRGASRHYRTVPYDEIPALVLGASVWKPARVFWFGVWTTKTSLPFGMELLRAAGTKYVTAWTWWKLDGQGKLFRGMGQYGRHSVEFLLWGRRGQPGRNGDAWQKAIADFEAPVGEHSEKPPFAYEQALAVFGGPALAMFERGERPGFQTWGDEAP